MGPVISEQVEPLPIVPRVGDAVAKRRSGEVSAVLQWGSGSLQWTWTSSRGGVPLELRPLSQTGFQWDFSLSCTGEHISATWLILLLEAVIGRDVTRNGSSSSVTLGVEVSVCVCGCVYIYLCMCVYISPIYLFSVPERSSVKKAPYKLLLHLFCSILPCTLLSLTLPFQGLCRGFTARHVMWLQELCRAGGGGRGDLSPAASFSMPKRTYFVFHVALLALGTNPAKPFGGAVPVGLPAYLLPIQKYCSGRGLVNCDWASLAL